MNISDIAKLAGVGVGTVSRVLNNHPDVKDKTREMVLEIINSSNYVPNNSARNLKKTHSNSIGVLVRSVFNPFFSEMIDEISKIIVKSGYVMILQHNDYSEKDELFNVMSFVKERKLEGIIYLGCNLKELDQTTFSNINIPVVLASVNTVCNEGISNFSSVGIENNKVGFDTTNYLINLGHKNIAIVLGVSDDIGVGRERFLGYLDALTKSNINFKEERVIYGNYSSRGAYKATLELLKNDKDLTAIFCISDIMAMGVAKAVYDSGLKLGDDISLIGVDGMDVSEFNNPPITTVVQPRKEMAEISVELLLELISGKCENKHVILETELVERDSCRSI